MAKKEKIFTVGWDCDGVFLESHEPVLSNANLELTRILGKKIQIEKSDLTSWSALYDQTLALTSNPEITNTINQYWFTPDILRLSPVNQAAIEVFRRCGELSNVRQRIITTRTPACRQCTQDSLEPFLPNFNWQQHFHIRGRSSQLSGDDFKIQQLKQFGVGLMNEDNLVTVSLIQTELPACRINYFSQPWNSQDNDPFRNLLRVDPYNPDKIFERILEARENFLSK